MLSRALRGSWGLHASMALIWAAAASGLTLLLRLQHRPYLIPMIAVLVSALRGGFAAGLLCGAASLLLAEYLVIHPVRQFRMPSDAALYDMAVITAAAAIISIVASRRRQAQLTLEATLASIGDGVVVTDPDGRVTFLNDVAERLTGWTAGEAKHQPLHRVFNIVNEESRRSVESPVDRALRDGKVVGLANHTLLVARDGTEVPISDSGAPIKDVSGRTVGAVLVFRDASALRQAEEALKRQAVERQVLLDRERRARSESERANRLKDEFLATLSHELRTPLNAVLGWAHMLTRRQLTGDQQRQALAAIYRNAQAQARLVDDVLDSSRIVTGRMALGAEAVDVTEIVRTTAESFTPAVLGKRQELRLELASCAKIAGDPHRLRQVVWNLLSNATKFTPDGGDICCRVATEDDQVTFTVSDTGQGIDPAFLPYVFDRFRQGDASTTRQHGGLGLGLSLVRYLVEAHGGTVDAASAGPGQGTTISAKFPALVSKAEGADAVLRAANRV